MKLNKIFEVVENSHREFLKWKRKNVTLRGVKEFGQENGVYGSMGKGLYTAFLSNKSMAKEYGEVYYVVNGIPKNPIVVDSINNWEIWSYNNLYNKYGGRRDFEKNTNLNDAITELGYDGVVIKGREMVNFKPENILYFKTDRELENYYYSNVLNEDLTYRHTNTDGAEDDEYEIGMVEDYSHNLTFDNKLEFGDDEKIRISNVTAEQLIIKQGEFDGVSAKLIINMPWDSPVNNSNGINVNFEVIDGVLYQIHIFLSKNVRGLGLGYKIFKALINDFGHVLARKSGSMNKSEIPKIWNKLNSESNITSYANDYVNVAILDNNPHKKDILEKLGF